MSINLVDYKKEYYNESLKLLRKAWNFYKLFPTIKEENHEMVDKAFLDLCLNESHYKKVVVDNNNKVLGYLFAKDNSQKQSLKYYLDNCYYYILSLLGKFGDRKYFKKIMEEIDIISKKVVPKDPQFHTEVKLFIVSRESRGLGVGRFLMDDYINNYCKNKNYKKTILFTDEKCTYSFYDKYGFKRYKESKVKKELSHVLGENAFSYVYNIK